MYMQYSFSAFSFLSSHLIYPTNPIYSQPGNVMKKKSFLWESAAQVTSNSKLISLFEKDANSLFDRLPYLKPSSPRSRSTVSHYFKHATPLPFIDGKEEQQRSRSVPPVLKSRAKNHEHVRKRNRHGAQSPTKNIWKYMQKSRRYTVSQWY